MQLILTIPDAVAQRVIDAVCAYYNFSDTSGLTRPQFVKASLVHHVKGLVGQVEARLSEDVARQKALSRVESEIDIS